MKIELYHNNIYDKSLFQNAKVVNNNFHKPTKSNIVQNQSNATICKVAQPITFQGFRLDPDSFSDKELEKAL